MKTYRLPRKVVAEINQLIAADKPSPRPPSALVLILKLLCDSRNYERAGIFLLVNGREVPRAFSGTQTAAPQPGPDLSVPLRIAGRTLGSLWVQLAPGHGFSPEERVLLHEVAQILAVYLTGKGRYLVRKSREALRGTPGAGSTETHTYQSAPYNASPLETLRAAAGDKSRS